jgi:hypothetical protein
MTAARAAAALAAWSLAGALLAQDVAVVAPFSHASPGGPLPAGWTPLTFPHVRRHTSYALVRDAEAGVVLRAEADASASGLVAKLDLPPGDGRRIAWRWKVERPIERGDLTRKSGDDYAARVYVAFRYAPERLGWFERARYELVRLWLGEYPPHAGLNYVWDAHAPVGTTVPNAYERRVRMIVVESGAARLGRWLDYERDVLADYRAAFGEEPPPIAGVALMTDADDTGERAIAYYGDVTLSRAGPPGR